MRAGRSLLLLVLRDLLVLDELAHLEHVLTAAQESCVIVILNWGQAGGTIRSRSQRWLLWLDHTTCVLWKLIIIKQWTHCLAIIVSMQRIDHNVARFANALESLTRDLVIVDFFHHYNLVGLNWEARPTDFALTETIAQLSVSKLCLSDCKVTMVRHARTKLDDSLILIVSNTSFPNICRCDELLTLALHERLVVDRVGTRDTTVFK